MFKLFLIAFALLVQSSALAAPTPTCTRTYVVQAGDTCDTISAANNVSTFQLAFLNPDINQSCSNLKPGQTLCLGTQSQDCTTNHVVTAGETCAVIQQNAGVDPAIFSANNPQIGQDCLNLYVGEVVCIATQVTAASTTPAGPPVTNTPTQAPAPSQSSSPASAVVAAVTTYNEPALSAPAALATPTNPSDTLDDEDVLYCDEL